MSANTTDVFGVEIDNPDVLRERIHHLEAMLEFLHDALHNLGLAQTAVQMIAPTSWCVFVALLCSDADPDNYPPGVLAKIEETLTAYEVGLASGTKKRTVKR